MARLKIDGILVLSYEYELYKDIYWKDLSEMVIDRYGKGRFTSNEVVETILLDCFNNLIKHFKEIITKETELSFFLYVYFLHEESLKLYIKQLGGFELETISESDFATYRRILKLVLEQGCDIDLFEGKFPTSDEVYRMEEIIQRLYYIGMWIYQFADFIAYQKMIDEAHVIEIEHDELTIDWQHHYGIAYKSLMSKFSADYKNVAVEEDIVEELKKAIDDCFCIDYIWAGSLIFEIKKHFRPEDPSLQTIEPYVLPENLSQQFDISQDLAEMFYNGISISRNNKMSIEDVIIKPYSTERYMYRPILIYNIGGIPRALVGEEKFKESIMVLATNAISWNSIPLEWRKNRKMLKFISRKGNEHDKILEDKIEQIIRDKELLFCRNIKSFKLSKSDSINIDNELAGEIDFIIINKKNSIIYVADSKYNKAKYEAVGYRADYSNFLKSYEPQLSKKVNWINDNKEVLEKHLKIINNLTELDLSSFNVEGVFFINTPTFYMFNGKYKAITLNHIADYITGINVYKEIAYKDSIQEIRTINHPYFVKKG